MSMSRVSGLATIAIVAAFVTACGPTEPDLEVELDTEVALADYEALDALLGSTELAGFRALGHRTPFGGAPTAIDAIAGMRASPNADAGRRFALDLVERLHAPSVSESPMTAPIISATHRGATFVYDPVADDYAHDPDRTGAPDSGVRFVIYEVDSDGRPIVDQETGYADLVDEGDGSQQDIVLRLTVVQHESTVLDYRTTLDGDEDRGELTVRGFLQDEGVRLDFDIEVVGTDDGSGQTLDLAFDLRVETRAFSITGTVSGVREGEEGEGDIHLTVRHRTHSIEIDVLGSEGMIEGTIFLDGDVFVTVSGPSEEPTFLGQTGNPLTLGEVLVLHRIFDGIEDVFDFLEDLIDPVDDLVVLGIIL